MSAEKPIKVIQKNQVEPPKVPKAPTIDKQTEIDINRKFGFLDEKPTRLISQR